METWSVEFDSGTIALPAIQRACHQLAASADLAVETSDDGKWRVRVYGSTSEAERRDLERRLRAAVLDFSLRELIEARTRIVRETLVQIALGEARPGR